MEGLRTGRWSDASISYSLSPGSRADAGCSILLDPALSTRRPNMDETGRSGLLRATLTPVPIDGHPGYACGVPTRRTRAVCRWSLPGSSSPLLGALAAVAILVGGGCGGSRIGLQNAPSTTATPRVATTANGNSSTSGTVPTDNGQSPAILAAYEGSLTDFNAIATKAPVQGNNPMLADHMDGQQLKYVISQLLKLAQAGQVDVGMLSTIHARIKEFNGTEAVVEACGRDTVQIASASIGQVVQPTAPSTELINALVQEAAGVWKVTYQSNVSPGCS